MGANGSSDYYTRLEVSRGASRHDIVGAYRRLAMGVHPDSHPEDPDAAARFREITEAYEVLGDPGRRALYDRQLEGARLRVRVRDLSGADADGSRQGARRDSGGQPVFLGSSRPRPDDVALGGWPVWYEPAGGRAPEVAPADRWISEVSDLLRRIVASWWEL